MARTANPDEVQTGIDAFEHVQDVWQDVGLGMVDAEYHTPYLIITRGGADWTLFLPLTDDEAVLVPHEAVNGEVTVRTIPEELRAEGEAPVEAVAKLQRAFENENTGMYPLDDGFNVGFKEDGTYYDFVVSHVDGDVYITES